MALPQTLRDRMTLPAVVAPMFLCSGVALATEACKAGIIGSLTRNHCRDVTDYEAQLVAVANDLARFRDEGGRSAPLAINISRRFAPAEMRAQVEIARRHGADIMITASGDPACAQPSSGTPGCCTGMMRRPSASPKRRSPAAWTGSSRSVQAAAAIPARHRIWR